MKIVPPIDHEEEVMMALMNGSKKAFETIYRSRQFMLFHFIRRMVDDQQAAEDIATDTFLKCWERHADFSELKKLDSFLFTVAKNACLNYRRDKKRQTGKLVNMFPLDFEEQPDLAEIEISVRVYEFIFREIALLPKNMQEVLKAHLEGHKNETIAADLGLAEKTVRNLKAEAIRTLRLRMSGKDFALLQLALLFFF